MGIIHHYGVRVSSNNVGINAWEIQEVLIDGTVGNPGWW